MRRELFLLRHVAPNGNISSREVCKSNCRFVDKGAQKIIVEDAFGFDLQTVPESELARTGKLEPVKARIFRKRKYGVARDRDFDN